MGYTHIPDRECRRCGVHGMVSDEGFCPSCTIAVHRVEASSRRVNWDSSKRRQCKCGAYGVVPHPLELGASLCTLCGTIARLQNYEERSNQAFASVMKHASNVKHRVSGSMSYENPVLAALEREAEQVEERALGKIELHPHPYRGSTETLVRVRPPRRPPTFWERLVRAWKFLWRGYP